MPVALFVVMKKFNLHLRHIHAGWTFAFAALATDAKIHRILDDIGREDIAIELSADRQPQCIRPSACDMLLVACRSIAWAHGACVKFSAIAVVVAHLDSAGKTTGVFPVERRFQFLRFVFRFESKQRPIILLRRVDDLAGIHQPLWIEQRFDFAQRRR